MMHTLRIAAALAACLCVGWALAADKPSVLQLGSSGSLTKELPRSKVETANDALKKLIRDETGFKSELVVTGSLEKLEEDVKSGKLHLGLFQGYEFAWARERNPHLKGLALAVNQYPRLQTYVIVKADAKGEKLADFQGKVLAMPKVSLEHGKLLVNRAAGDKKPEEFFSKVAVPETAEDALDDVVDGLAAAVVVDQVPLEAYKRRKPGRFAKLKELHKPEVFPTAVVAYQEGVLDKEVLARFRDGVIGANKKDEGKKVLDLWKLTGFEAVPDAYEKQLAEVLKTYPSGK